MQAHVEASIALPLQIGRAAQAAVQAVGLVRAGLKGPHDVLEGQFGYSALIEPLVHQNIVGLDGPDPMVVDLHVPILAHHGLAGPGLGIARVEEALAVPGPGGARKLDPAKMVAQIDTVSHPARSATMTA